MKNKILLLISIVVFCGCSVNQDLMILDARVAELEQYNLEWGKKYNNLKTNLNEAGNTGKKIEIEQRSKYAGIRVKLETLREDIQKLNGKIEEIEYFFQREKKAEESLTGKLDEISTDNQNRIKYLEQYVGLEASDKKNKIDKNIKTSPEKVSESALYSIAKKEFDKKAYESSKEKFLEFLKKYPKSNNADNAQFWIGEIYFQEKWYEKAILEYQTVIEKYQKGNKVPAALLKQGMAFYNLGEKANSRLVLKELVEKHPESNESKIAKQKLKAMN